MRPAGSAFFWQNQLPQPVASKPVSAQEHATYRFADCELDVRARRLQVRGQSAVLAPEVFDILAVLVEHAGQAVPTDALVTALSPHGRVHAANLTEYVALARRALGHADDDNSAIEAVANVGYRFVAPVQAVMQTAAPAATDDALARRRAADGDDEPRAPSPARTHAGHASKRVPSIRRSDQMLLLVIAVVLLALLALWYWWRNG